MPKVLSPEERYFVIAAVEMCLESCEENCFSLPNGGRIEMEDISSIKDGIVAAFVAQEELRNLLAMEHD